MTIGHCYYSCPTPPSHSHLLWHERLHAPVAHSPPSSELLPQLLLGSEGVITVLLHKGDVRRNDRLGTALHKAKHLLLGWRVKVIKKDTPDTPPLPTMGYKKVIVTPGKHSKTTEGKRDVRENQCEHFSLRHHPWLMPAQCPFFLSTSEMKLES